MKLSTEEIDAIIAGVEGVTPGPWERKGASVQSVATGYIMETSGTGGYVGSLSSPRGSDQRDIDAAYIASVDPATVLSLASEVKALREALTEIAKQQIRDEVAEHGPLTKHDFAGGYDVLVQLARNALAKTETHSGTDK